MVSAILSLTGLGMASGLILALVARRFAVHVDPKIERIGDLLPGINCGACGYGGCAAYARGLVLDGAEANLCIPGGPAVAAAVAAVMGVAAKEVVKVVAVVHCAGDRRFVKERYEHRGLRTCAAVHALAGGPKECAAGCLGLGDCVRVCGYDAISITAHGLAVIDPARCIGDGACVAACPRDLISMDPAARPATVLCSSRESPKRKRATCQVACIGCGLCAKTAPAAYAMDGSLARWAGDARADQGAAAQAGALVCPNQTILDLTRYGAVAWAREDGPRAAYQALQAEEKARAAEAKKRAKAAATTPAAGGSGAGGAA